MTIGFKLTRKTSLPARLISTPYFNNPSELWPSKAIFYQIFIFFAIIFDYRHELVQNSALISWGMIIHAYMQRKKRRKTKR